MPALGSPSWYLPAQTALRVIGRSTNAAHRKLMPVNRMRTTASADLRTEGKRGKRGKTWRAGAKAGATTARTLQGLRTDAGKTQKDVAVSSGVSQIEVSRAEHRTDHKVSTLRRYIKALGGELLIFARFGDRLVRLRDV